MQAMRQKSSSKLLEKSSTANVAISGFFPFFFYGYCEEKCPSL
jgi:hypothetical protein